MARKQYRGVMDALVAAVGLTLLVCGSGIFGAGVVLFMWQGSGEIVGIGLASMISGGYGIVTSIQREDDEEPKR